LTPLLVALWSSPLPDAESRSPNPEPRLSSAFSLGLVTGLVYFTGTLYWITHVMVVYGGFEKSIGTRLAVPVAALVNGALIAYLALFPALFAVIVRRLMIAFGAGAFTVAPLVWVATELGRAHLLTGFPWVLLGYSQVTVPSVAQLASVLGVYGVSALVAAVGAALARCAVTTEPAARRRVIAGVIAGVAGIAAWGAARASRAELTRMGTPVRVALVQGNVDEAEKTEAVRAQSIFDSYLSMTRDAIGRGAELVIWPESSTPFMLEEDPADAQRVRAIARQARVPILLGSDEIERGNPTKYYNSAFLIGTDGRTVSGYRKIHLVPFGEYVPFKRLLFFAGPLVDAVGPFSSGQRADLLPVDGHRISVAICYEVVYPALVRQFVSGGSELLTTITNDAWFGRTSAPYQHFAQASMRAIEEGRYLVRAANTGISGIVDPYGRVVVESGLYQPAVLLGEARFIEASTIYARIGDVFAYASAVATLVAMLLAGSPRRRVQWSDADRRRPDATLRGSHQARRRLAELSLKPPTPKRN
jgi:apolipoprotein N-acyltransferase